MKYNKPLYQSFVHPYLCKQLWNLGLNATTVFCWKKEQEDYLLVTLAFDEDGYYNLAYGNSNFVAPMPLFNAFQTADMEKLLPDYLLTKNNNEYELHCSSLFSLDIEKSDRMPDVFAKLVIKSIEQRKIDIHHAIKMITV